MLPFMILAVLWKGAVPAEGSTATTIEVLHTPPTNDLIGSCSTSIRRVEMDTVKVGGTRYKRQVLNENDYSCVSARAVLLQDAANFKQCFKKAFDREFNIFYMDDQEQCFGSNQQVAGDTESCTAEEGIVVYIATIPIVPYSMTAPQFKNFSITEVVVNQSFVVNFFPSCPSFEYLLLNEDYEILATVNNSDTITSDITPIPPCTLLHFALQASINGNGAGIAKLISVETPAVPDVINFSVDTFVVGKSFKVHFDAVCPLHYDFRLEFDDEMFESVKSGQIIRYPVPPCTEVASVLYVLEDNVVVAVVNASESPILTPTVLEVKDFYIDPFLSEETFDVSFNATCVDYYKFTLEFGGETFDDVRPGDSLAMKVTPCMSMTATLSATDENGDVAGPAITGTAKVIPFSFKEIEGFCFYFSEAVANYTVAKASCPIGSVFATPTDSSTRNGIVAHLKSELPDSDGWYVDVTRQTGVWTYGDGTQASGSGLTNARDQSCARFRKETGYKLEDIYCWAKYTFICQYSA